MRHTIQTRLRLSGVEQAVLSELLDVAGKARRAASRKYWVDGLDPVSLVRWISDNYGLHSRQAQSIQIGLDQVERSWREGLVGRMQLAGQSVAYFTRLVHENSVALADAKLDFHHKPKRRDATSVRIAKLKSALFQSRSRLDKAMRNLKNAQAELTVGRPKVCFGGKQLARHRADVGQPKARYATLDDWRSAWKQARDGETWIVGSGKEPMGNLSCRFDPVAKTLTVSITADQAQRKLDQLLSQFKKVPSRVKGLMDTKRIVIGQVEFHSKAHSAISDALANGQPISMRLLRRFQKNGEEAIYLHATFDVDSPAPSDLTKGAIGVEFNGRRCAWVAVDDRGNLTRSIATSPVVPYGSILKQVPTFKGSADWNLSSARKGQRIDSVRKSAKAIADAAKKSSANISIGAEGYAQRQKELKSSGVARGVRASDYIGFHSALRRAAEKAGVKIVQVQAGGSACIGFTKFSEINGLSVESAAAFETGRKAVLGRPGANPKKSPKGKARRNCLSQEYLERVAFSRSMPSIERCIERRPRDSAWKRIAKVMGKDQRLWRACLFGPGVRPARPRFHRGRKAPPLAGNSDRAE